MSIWSKIIESVSGNNVVSAERGEALRDATRYALVDCEVGLNDKKIHDIGAIRWDGAIFHSADRQFRHARPYDSKAFDLIKKLKMRLKYSHQL